MKIVIIGGTGLIGSNVAQKLRQLDHTVIAAAPSTGVNAFTGEGLTEALQDTDVVIDLSNSPSFDAETAVNFFDTVGRNILPAEINAGVKHHLILSIVGMDRMQNVGYMQAKQVQEELVKKSGVPYTIIRSTQFQEFVPTITAAGTQEQEVHISTLDFQPIAAEDVARFITRFATEEPAQGILEIAGPDRKPLSEFVEGYVGKAKENLRVIPNDRKKYLGTPVPQSALVPEQNTYLGEIRFQQFLNSL